MYDSLMAPPHTLAIHLIAFLVFSGVIKETRWARVTNSAFKRSELAAHGMLKSFIDQNLVFCHDLGLDNESTPKRILALKSITYTIRMSLEHFLFTYKAAIHLSNLLLFFQIMECR